MSFRFQHVCELFEQLARAHTKGGDTATVLVQSWFRQHDDTIPRQGSPALALLSCLLPARRTDRVCGFQEVRLRKAIQNAQGLGKSRMLELQRWQGEHGLDFGSAVEQVLSATDASPSSSSAITIEEVDHTLDQLASTCAFSSLETRQRRKGEPTEIVAGLTRLFRRADSQQAKWLIRLIQKDIRPAVVPETILLQCFHLQLSTCLAVRSSLPHALQFLDAPANMHIPSHPSATSQHALKPSVLAPLEPQLGVMVSLPPFEKARSIEHCCQLVGKHSASVEQKYDGEYCQIHLNACPGGAEIKIFSKSGRDSTKDRYGIHDAVKRCLRIGTADSPVKRRCIIVGELLVWNGRRQAIMPFYKIRRHVLRAGYRIGCARDSPPSEDEHLMVMLYDILLVDEVNYLYSSYASRRQRLHTLVLPLPGRVDIGTRTEINFQQPDAMGRLRDMMLKAGRQGWEGLVLKRSSECYLWPHGRPWQIKLKKDYIPGLADSADLVVIGGRRDPKLVQTWGVGSLSWTTFHLACLEHSDGAGYSDAKPIFRVVGTVARPCMSIADLRHLNRIGKLCQIPFTPSESHVAVRCNLPKAELPTELFQPPMVVEVIGAGFDRPSNEDFYSLRFPRVIKIHGDRHVQDAISFAEYQRLALQSLKNLREGDPIPVENALLSPSTSTIPNERAVSCRSTASITTVKSSTPEESATGGSFSDDTITRRNDLAEKENAVSMVKRRTTTSPFPRTFNGSKRRRLISSHLTEAPKADTISASPSPPLTSQSEQSVPSQDRPTASPMLIHESAAKFFRGPDMKGSQILSQTSINVTFDIIQFTCHGPSQGSAASRTSGVNGHVFDVVFVEWSDTGTALADIESMVSMFRHPPDITISSVARKIIFTDWRALRLFNATDIVRLTPFGKYVKAYMSYEKGEVQSVVYGKVDWAHLLTRESER